MEGRSDKERSFAHYLYAYCRNNKLTPQIKGWINDNQSSAGHDKLKSFYSTLTDIENQTLISHKIKLKTACNNYILSYRDALSPTTLSKICCDMKELLKILIKLKSQHSNIQMLLTNHISIISNFQNQLNSYKKQNLWLWIHPSYRRKFMEILKYMNNISKFGSSSPDPNESNKNQTMVDYENANLNVLVDGDSFNHALEKLEILTSYILSLQNLNSVFSQLKDAMSDAKKPDTNSFHVNR